MLFLVIIFSLLFPASASASYFSGPSGDISIYPNPTINLKLRPADSNQSTVITTIPRQQTPITHSSSDINPSRQHPSASAVSFPPDNFQKVVKFFHHLFSIKIVDVFNQINEYLWGRGK